MVRRITAAVDNTTCTAERSYRGYLGGATRRPIQGGPHCDGRIRPSPRLRSGCRGHRSEPMWFGIPRSGLGGRWWFSTFRHCTQYYGNQIELDPSRVIIL